MKLIIDIPYEAYYTFKCDLGKGNLNALAEIVANGTPYNPSGDCISREALKNVILNDSKLDGANANWEVNRILAHIDNALTVEAYTSEDIVKYVSATEDLVREKLERLKGEWKTFEGYDGDEYYECSNCSEPWFLESGTPKDNNMNFCPNCGADMREGGAE